MNASVNTAYALRVRGRMGIATATQDPANQGLPWAQRTIAIHVQTISTARTATSLADVIMGPATTVPLIARVHVKARAIPASRPAVMGCAQTAIQIYGGPSATKNAPAFMGHVLVGSRAPALALALALRKAGPVPIVISVRVGSLAQAATLRARAKTANVMTGSVAMVNARKLRVQKVGREIIATSAHRATLVQNAIHAYAPLQMGLVMTGSPAMAIARPAKIQRCMERSVRRPVHA
jgi:hypothetical protein